ncbi:F-box/kelch-repeat protein At3g23880-like [Rutidosis leptorrhynchoides]|uniref:F-box/kelch-repeat protein At3g23880-like n=1 Tax=Rutidosis leptorrhynchoides TaxID=125765 RepID=UPI003A9A4BC0
MVLVELCEDLLDEIIARLPPKFILQFRCVSKSRCSRIDSSNFIRKQSIQSATRARRTVNVAHQVHIEKDVFKMLHGSKRKGPFLELDSLKLLGGFNAFDSCYGIMCLYKKTNFLSITLWNPSIRRKLNVPNVPYDPCQKYSVVFGFGYDPIVDDYNIVGLSYGTNLQTLFLFSTKKNVWSEIDLPKADPPFMVRSSQASFVDGVMHWLVQNDSPNTNDSYILTFDLSNRVFGTISLPNITRGNTNLLITNGYLSVISDDGVDSSMWLRKIDDNNLESWSKPFKVRCYDIIGGTRVYRIKKEVPKAYNPFSGVSRIAVSSSNSSVKYEINVYVETLALLDNKNCSTNE